LDWEVQEKKRIPGWVPIEGIQGEHDVLRIRRHRPRIKHTKGKDARFKKTARGKFAAKA
jgi:hypothetical protein